MTGQGFADDCGPMIGGDNTHEMYKSMQRMLNKLYHWGEGKNLILQKPLRCYSAKNTNRSKNS